MRKAGKPPPLEQALLILFGLSACAIHHATPYIPAETNAPQTADALEASASCLEASTSAEIAICAAPSLVVANRGMLQAEQAALRVADIFGRDAVLASQRVWLLALPTRCHLPDTQAAAPQAAQTCLQSALADRTGILRDWPVARGSVGAIAQYVSLRAPAGSVSQPDPPFCASFAERAQAALRRTGTLDPAAMGYQEVAGTHGPQAAPPVSVDLYDANAYALFQRRARGVAIGADAVVTPISLTELVESRHTGNQGGRFSAFASQTGDYGSLDVLRDGSRTLAVAADPWGFTTPAAPGEAAHAGVWDISTSHAVPVCLFDTYTRPGQPGVFGQLPDLAAWRATLAQISVSAALPLGGAVLRDQGQLAADAGFIVLYMPLLAIEQAAGSRTPWLRARHDAVLDALSAWSARTAANKALFDQLFAQLRPAAADLVRGYQTGQALDASEARAAGAVAIMELLYQATVNIAPGLGRDPATAPGYRARYPIIAAPQ